ncbi:hypothetical protein TYRP_018487 [Tyrophagus putrescentiae]|nr:hypothetical protein TYRP_018487 [Tyrophagus putrescentiae]
MMTFWLPSLFLAPIGWHPRPHSGLKIITTSSSSQPLLEHKCLCWCSSSFFPFLSQQQPMARPTTTRMDGDQDELRRGWTTTRTIRMDGNEEDDYENRRPKTEDRRLKTEDRRPTTGRRGSRHWRSFC